MRSYPVAQGTMSRLLRWNMMEDSRRKTMCVCVCIHINMCIVIYVRLDLLAVQQKLKHCKPTILM